MRTRGEKRENKRGLKNPPASGCKGVELRSNHVSWADQTLRQSEIVNITHRGLFQPALKSDKKRKKPHPGIVTVLR